MPYAIDNVCFHLTMNEDEGHQGAEQGGEVTYDLQSVKEAARLLRVSESTV
jgi:hypothetical protein